MSEPKWIELAEIVSERTATRKDVEWKLAVEHFGALGLSVYAVSTFLTSYAQKEAWFCWAGGILVFVSLLTSWLWIFLIESAHSIDGLLYRAYMDLANGLTTSSVAKMRVLQAEWQSAERKQTDLPCEWIAEKWTWFGEEQRAWFLVHWLFSFIVHVAVFIMLYGIAHTVPTPK